MLEQAQPRISGPVEDFFFFPELQLLTALDAVFRPYSIVLD